MANDLDQAYALCEQITRAQAGNFYYAFRTLPARQRRAIYAAYAFCRRCDDIADDDLPIEAKQRLLAETRDLLADGHHGAQVDPVFRALGDAARAFDIPARYFRDVVDGVETDLAQSRYEDFEQLRTYCYKVASAVGLISIEVFGYVDPAAREYAIDLGLAMQLTNIIRDLKEDARRGRIYIPLEELASFGYSETELTAGVVNDQFRALMRFQVARARKYFDSGRRLTALLPRRSRACPAVLLGLYSAILDRVEVSDYDVFQRRIGLSTREKLLLTVRLWATSMMPKAIPQRK